MNIVIIENTTANAKLTLAKTASDAVVVAVVLPFPPEVPDAAAAELELFV